MGVQVSRRRFEELVAAALDGIPDELAAQMDNVAVVVEDAPASGDVLGHYQGVDLPSRSPLSYGGVTPDVITIYRLPLCELAADEAELARQVRITVLHEVGHHFGLSDEDLERLGWA